MDEAIEFLRAVVDAEWRANRANYAEPDDAKLQAVIHAWDAMFGPGLSSGLSRPSGDPPALFASTDYVEAAARQQPRTLFAVARYRHDGADVFRGWLGDTERGPRGEGIRQCLYVARAAGAWKIVSRYQVCNTCRGAMTMPDGQRCSSCNATGWYFRGGTDWTGLGAPKEVRMLAVPSDPMSQRTHEVVSRLAAS